MSAKTRRKARTRKAGAPAKPALALVDGNAAPVIAIRPQPAPTAPPVPVQKVPEQPDAGPGAAYAALLEEIAEYAAAATLHAGSLGFGDLAPYALWTGTTDGQATALLADGTRLVYTPGPTKSLAAYRMCPHGWLHGHPTTSPLQLRYFEQDTRVCTHHRGQPQRVMPLHEKPREHPHG